MVRSYGSRSRGEWAPGASSSQQSAQRDSGASSTELSVLRTALRRLGYVGLQVFDLWAEGADEAELSWANDNVKPVLDQLCHLPGAEGGK